MRVRVLDGPREIDESTLTAMARAQMHAAKMAAELGVRKAEWVERCAKRAMERGVLLTDCYILEYAKDPMRSTFVERGKVESEFRIITSPEHTP